MGKNEYLKNQLAKAGENETNVGFFRVSTLRCLNLHSDSFSSLLLHMSQHLHQIQGLKDQLLDQQSSSKELGTEIDCLRQSIREAEEKRASVLERYVGGELGSYLELYLRLCLNAHLTDFSPFPNPRQRRAENGGRHVESHRG